MSEEPRKQVEVLIKKASEAADSNDAMRFAQAAVNAANALRSLNDVPSIKIGLSERV